MDPSTLDEAAAQLENEDAPSFKQLDGYKGMTLIADRDSGKTIALTFWESEEAMRASEESVKDARRRAAETGGARRSRRSSASRSCSTRWPDPGRAHAPGRASGRERAVCANSSFPASPLGRPTAKGTQGGDHGDSQGADPQPDPRADG